jgi:ATP-dependent RNA helicase DDX21
MRDSVAQEEINIVIKKAKTAAGAAMATSFGKGNDKKKRDKENGKKTPDRRESDKGKKGEDHCNRAAEASGDEEMQHADAAKKPRQSPRLKPMSPPATTSSTPKWGEKVDKKRKRDEDIEASEDSGNSPLSDFDISGETKAKLKEAGITSLFPIQSATFKHVTAGKDLIARARTGSGKTLSFVLPIHERIVAMRSEGKIATAVRKGRAPVCLILSPTRELTKQIGKVFEMVAAGSMTVLTVYGGVPYEQQRNELRAGVDVVVGTPGRVMDLIEHDQLKVQTRSS